jgi:hypothetical protein
MYKRAEIKNQIGMLLSISSNSRYNCRSQRRQAWSTAELVVTGLSILALLLAAGSGGATCGSDPAVIDVTATGTFWSGDDITVSWTSCNISGTAAIYLEDPDVTLGKYQLGDGASSPATVEIPAYVRSGDYNINVVVGAVTGQSVNTYAISGLSKLYVNRTDMKLGRDLVGIRIGANDVFLSWRMLQGDTDSVRYQVRRSTSYHDGDCSAYSKSMIFSNNNITDIWATNDKTYYYCVRPVVSDGAGGYLTYGEFSNIVRVTGSVVSDEAAATLAASNTCGGATLSNVHITHVLPADLDGNGLMDLVVRFCDDVDGVANICNNKNKYIQAFIRSESTGEFENAWCYNPQMTSADMPLKAWDLDDDGTAEVLTTTNQGEYLRAINGVTGEVKATIAKPIGVGTKDFQHNSVAYFDGRTPLWILQTNPRTPDVYFYAYSLESSGFTEEFHRTVTTKMGTHGLPVGDLDMDGKDEAVPCPGVLQNLFVDKWIASPMLEKHHDTCVIGDMRTDLKGLEIFYGAEDNQNKLTNGAGLLQSYDTFGEAIWQKSNTVGYYTGGNYNNVSFDYHGFEKGWCADISNYSEATECYTFEHCEQSGCLSQIDPDWEDLPDLNRAWIWGVSSGSALFFDPQTKTNRTKYRPADWVNGEGLAERYGAAMADGHSYIMAIDILGDSREELFNYGSTAAQFKIYTNTDATSVRYMSPLHDPAYLKAMTQAGDGYLTDAKSPISKTFTLACDADNSNQIAANVGGEASFLCGVTSLRGFEGDVRVVCKRSDLGECYFDKERTLNYLDINMQANRSALFRVYFRANDVGTDPFEVAAKSRVTDIAVDRFLWMTSVVEE